jgi:hypothetical protein
MESHGRVEERWSAAPGALSTIQRFLSWEAAGGLTLVPAAVVAWCFMYSLVESRTHDDRVITDRENKVDPARRRVGEKK